MAEAYTEMEFTVNKAYQDTPYNIQVCTNNKALYNELKDYITRVIAEYEAAEKTEESQ
jgi:hypothetical protein